MEGKGHLTAGFFYICTSIMSYYIFTMQCQDDGVTDITFAEFIDYLYLLAA